MRRGEQIDRIARDCVYFKGDRPCTPHQRHGRMCRCETYCPGGAKVLVIQLSSPVDVVRSSALLERLRMEDTNSRVTYLSDYADLLGAAVDEPLNLDDGAVVRLQMEQFDCLYNLDLNRRACAITNLLNADLKKGFYLRGGWPAPIDADGEGAYLRAVMPRAGAVGRISRVQELFQVCDLEYRREAPRLAGRRGELFQRNDAQVVVGLAGMMGRHDRSQSYWEPMRWVKIIELLTEQGIMPVLLGDQQGDRFHRQIAQSSEVEYPGPLARNDLLVALGQCDIVVGVDEMMVETALALGKRAVLPADSNHDPIDLELFGDRARVVKPVGASTTVASVSDILPDTVLHAVFEQINSLTERGAVVVAGSEPIGNERNMVRQQVGQSRHGPK